MAILLHAISFYGCLHRTTAQRRQKVHKKESILQKCLTPRIPKAHKRKKRNTFVFLFRRGDRIRTCDHLVPNQVRYRTALHPENIFIKAIPMP